MTDIAAEARNWFEGHWDPAMPLGEWWRALADHGFAFPQWPEGFGGRGLSGRDAKAIVAARRSVGAYGPPNGVATFLVAPTLLTMGSPEQQQRYIPGIVDGTTHACPTCSGAGAVRSRASARLRLAAKDRSIRPVSSSSSSARHHREISSNAASVES